MNISELLVTKPEKAKIEYLEGCAEIRINKFMSLVGQPSEHPHIVTLEYKNHFKAIDKEWTRVVHHNILHGRKSKRIFLQRVGKFNIDFFMDKKLKFRMHHKKESHVRMNYSYYNFSELAKMETAMLFFKYGDEVMRFEVRIAIIELLLNYFQLYTEHDDYEPFPRREWIIQPGEIEKCIDEVLNLSTESIKPYMDYIDTKYRILIQRRFCIDEFKKPLRPKTKEELMSVVKEGMSQTEISEAIQDYWEVGDRTARSWMNRFGISRKYNSRNIDQVKDSASNITLIQSERQNVNLEQQDSISQKTEEQNAQILILESQINALSAENQKLKEENDRLKSVAENPSQLIERNRILGLNNESLNKKVNELKEYIKSLTLTGTPNNS